MKRLILFAMLAVAAAPRLYAWDDRLHGTPMGSVSVDYSTGLASESVNTPAAAFDGKYNTYYASYDRSNTWVGLDLGRKCVITGVGYASRAGRADRLQLGIFEGSNSPDFLDAVPLYIIKDKPSDNVLVNDSVHVSRAFRYVRYVGPNNARCNIAEVCFYGHEGEGNDSLFYTPTNLPRLHQCHLGRRHGHSPRQPEHPRSRQRHLGPPQKALQDKARPQGPYARHAR